MRKFPMISAVIAYLAAAAPALAQGYPGSLPRTDVRAAAVYGENHGGGLSAWISGKSTASHIVVSERAPKAPPLA